MSEPVFGDRFENPVASEDNPTRIGTFVRKIYRGGRLNRGLHYELTDEKGNFWIIRPDKLIRLESES